MQLPWLKTPCEKSRTFPPGPPMEQIWEWIKNHFLSNQCYGVYEDIVTMACYAWNQLSKDVNLVKSIMYRDWINTPR